jgi:hypothetical protein
MRSLAALLVSSALALPVHAQLMSSPVQDYINKTTLLNNILGNARATAVSQRAQTNAPSSSPAVGGDGAAVTPTAFRHTGRSILPAMLAQRSTGTEADKQQALQFFESQLDLYKRTATTDKFPPDELAYAMEYLLVNSYMTFHDLHDLPWEKDPRAKRGRGTDRLQILAEKKALKPTITQERAVFGQMATLLSANPAVAKLGDREKQELTELLAIMLGVNYAMYMRGIETGDEKLLAQARETARLNIERVLGLPMAKVKIDDSGISQ